MNRIDTPFLPSKGIIRSIVTLAPDNHLFEIQLAHPDGLSRCLPGQFVELWIPGVGEAPISVCSGRQGNILELCVRKVGRVTGALFQLQEGDWVGLRGPFGNGFPLPQYQNQDLVLIAGGLGVAPIRSLWQYLLENREQFGKIIIVYGMRHSIDLLFRAELKILLRRHDLDVYIAAEDVIGPELPPIAFQLGRVTDMLKMADIGPQFQAAICGPPVMYPYVIEVLKSNGLDDARIWLSLERQMKCAVGKCGHCFVSGSFTCRDGPVFCLTDLRFLPEAVECA